MTRTCIPGRRLRTYLPLLSLAKMLLATVAAFDLPLVAVFLLR